MIKLNLFFELFLYISGYDTNMSLLRRTYAIRVFRLFSRYRGSSIELTNVVFVLRHRDAH